MKSNIKRLWVKALRSGKYDQCKDRLRDFNGTAYCCLGVLTQLYAKSKHKSFSSVTKERDGGILPHIVCEWAGLRTQDPTIHGRSLACRNDGGQSFHHIAHLIEYNL